MSRAKLIVTFAFFVFGPSVALADKLSDFKDADRYEKGCDSIPATYSSERSACNSEAPNVHPWCDGSKGPVTCGSSEDTRKAKRNVEEAKKNIETLKDKKSRAESNRSSAQTDDDKRRFGDEVTQLERELHEAGRQIEQSERELEARKRLIEDAINTLDKCVAYRRAVMNSFASALDRVRNENETPELQEVARSLRSKYEKEKSGHEEQITAKTNALNHCREWRP
ncbi:MAG: hypothetical protein U1A78_31020 [Polyangia bacterium]